ncbi:MULTISPECIES: CFI-box-CTERM domain-containing protein [Caproicibacterium]|uniref:CFI-box-CTERM domain-containing protein n=1 Tax=Caproicibacterium argilliputei TaxID=3030016 RepID=A0AA97H3I2_9FIRM|nr:CFI-box-CTERM domain-containing protein [Caproicibacterium argilliputei]WOC33257.1 CFI-box-CTERM domain-containing protein [Caproicibacterium argilliputei]
MQYKAIHCPYCGLELQVPVGVQQIVCMYCAKPIDLAALEAPVSTQPDSAERLRQALALLDDSLFQFEVEESSFTQKAYPACFSAYRTRFDDAVKALHGVREEDCSAFAEALLKHISEVLHSRRVRSPKSSAFFRYRMMVEVYLVPALHDNPAAETDTVLASFLQLWNTQYPGEPLNPVSYETINSGWRKKGCYITTAVCQSLQKPDSCAELQTLRRFRDDWMRQQPGGSLLIQEYYTFAPSIVAAIDTAPNAAEIYRKLWNAYLLPCVRDAKHRRSARCLRRYTQMVLRLEKLYLSSTTTGGLS